MGGGVALGVLQGGVGVGMAMRVCGLWHVGGDQGLAVCEAVETPV